MNKENRKPTVAEISELSGTDILPPGGLSIIERPGEIVEMKGKKILDVACIRGILALYCARNERVFG